MPKSKRLMTHFPAADDHGRSHVVEVWQEFTEDMTADGPSASPGPKTLRVGRQAVNRLKKGEYQIVAAGTILRSSHPDAE